MRQYHQVYGGGRPVVENHLLMKMSIIDPPSFVVGTQLIEASVPFSWLGIESLMQSVGEIFD
jgi:hypothetical protein